MLLRLGAVRARTLSNLAKSSAQRRMLLGSESTTPGGPTWLQKNVNILEVSQEFPSPTDLLLNLYRAEAKHKSFSQESLRRARDFRGWYVIGRAFQSRRASLQLQGPGDSFKYAILPPRHVLEDMSTLFLI